MPSYDHHIAVELFKSTVELESDMRLLLKQKPSYDREVCAIRSKLRETYERIIFLDYEYAQSKDVEQNLWKYVFYKVIEDYRKRIRNASPNGKTRPGIARKLNSSFRSFLHEATGFYYSFIQKLAVHFELEQLDPIVKKFGLTNDIRNSRHSYPDNIKQRAVLSCHKSLIFLGDLARYREKQSNKPRKNWSTASDYYNQARQLIPESGNPHNQLAVIATYNNDDFSAVYHYYRSLVVRHPFLTAKDNINFLFQKTRNNSNLAEEKSRQRRFSRMRQGNGAMNKEKAGKAVEEFYADFIHLHSILFLKTDLELYFDLKKSVLNQLQEHIITRVLDADQLLRVNVINISALFVLRHIINDNRLNLEAMTMYGHASKKLLVEEYAFLLIIDTFKLLLEICESELRDVKSCTETFNNALQLLTAPVKRVLPSIRIGIKWIYANFAYIASMSTAIAEDSNIKEQHKEVTKFWENMANFLNTMERLFPHANGIPLEVPLKEDFELNGFSALKNETRFDPKQFVSESEPFEEIDMRIYDIVEDAHKIVASKAFELCNVNGLFTFKKPLSPIDVVVSCISNIVDEGYSMDSDMTYSYISAQLSDLTESHSASPNSSTNLSNDDDTGEVILFTGRQNANQRLNYFNN